MSLSDVILLLSLLGGAIYATFDITYKLTGTGRKEKDEPLRKK